MEMRNKDVIDLIIRYMKTPELMLGSFGTICLLYTSDAADD